MSAKLNSQIAVTWKQVHAFRLARHRLLERGSPQEIASIAYDMTGAQAQLFSAAQLSLGIRMQDPQLGDIQKALEKKTLVKASCMRRTLFLVPSKHLALFMRGVARRSEKEINWALRQGVPARTLDAAIDAVLTVMDEPLTRSEIAERTSRVLGLKKREVHGGGWGSQRKVAAVQVGHLTYPVVYLLSTAAARGVFCYGPYRGAEPTFVRADAWIPRWKDLPKEEAERMLLHKYLQTYGPASAADFAMWTSTGLTEARQLWASEASHLATVDVEGWKGTILRKDLDALTTSTLPSAHVRLLPYFDTFILGHKERAHLMDKEYFPKIYRPQGWVSPVVLVNGRVAGVWNYKQEKNRLVISVDNFASFPRPVLTRLHEEAQHVGSFLGNKNVDLQFR
jgi:uncharacterized protein YcaQ